MSGYPFIKQLAAKHIVGFSGVCYQCQFFTEHYTDSMAETLLGAPLHNALHKAVAKRKAEFVAGRYLARQALTALAATDTAVAIGPARQPLWPAPFIGSISHAKDFAICAVAHSGHATRIGIDVEDILDAKVATDIAGSVLNAAEYTLVGSLATPHPVMLSLIFSAKESLFKALYPEVGRFFGFEAATTTAIDVETGTFILELVQELTPALPAGTCFNGQFELDATKVLTVIT